VPHRLIENDDAPLSQKELNIHWCVWQTGWRRRESSSCSPGAGDLGIVPSVEQAITLIADRECLGGRHQHQLGVALGL
jgi:hypothetical protein